jgi:hypothetical protein
LNFAGHVHPLHSPTSPFVVSGATRRLLGNSLGGDCGGVVFSEPEQLRQLFGALPDHAWSVERVRDSVRKSEGRKKTGRGGEPGPVCRDARVDAGSLLFV